MGLLAVASTAANYSAAKGKAKAQEKQQQRASAAERRRVLKQFSSIRAQEGAENRAAAVELQKAQVASYEAYGEAAAIDSGIAGGNTIQAIQNEYLQALSNERQGIFQQLAENDIQRAYGFDSAAMQSEMNQININQPIAQADLFSSAIDGISTGLSLGSAAQQTGLFEKAPETT
jgi:hypothetical protein